jgi:chromosomal replication initiator protein
MSDCLQLTFQGFDLHRRGHRERRDLNTRQIQAIVAKFYHLKTEDMYGPRRLRWIARPRQIAMYLTRELTGHSLPRIGREFRRDHSTVHHGIHLVEELCRSDPETLAAVDALYRRLAG